MIQTKRVAPLQAVRQSRSAAADAAILHEVRKFEKQQIMNS